MQALMQMQTVISTAGSRMKNHSPVILMEEWKQILMVLVGQNLMGRVVAIVTDQVVVEVMGLAVATAMGQEVVTHMDPVEVKIL